jgi:hypothetical protein
MSGTNQGLTSLINWNRCERLFLERFLWLILLTPITSWGKRLRRDIPPIPAFPTYKLRIVICQRVEFIVDPLTIMDCEDNHCTRITSSHPYGNHQTPSRSEQIPDPGVFPKDCPRTGFGGTRLIRMASLAIGMC